MPSRASGTKKSSNPRTTQKFPKQPPGKQGRPARAHRDDTPEARLQRERIPKTHPTRAPSAARKDKAR